jgi:hypothetical protein
MSAHAQGSQSQVMTADVVYYHGAKRSVVDCALFIPNLDRVLGRGYTQQVISALKAKGYSPFVDSALKIENTTQADSAGHRVDEYFTDRDFSKLNRNPRGTVYMSLTGLRSSIKKRHKFTLRLHLIGQSQEIARSVQQGTLGQHFLNIQELPNCKPKNLSGTTRDAYTGGFADNRASSDEAASTPLARMEAHAQNQRL